MVEVVNSAWPDVGIKSGPIIPKVEQKVTKLKIVVFKKVTKYLGNFWEKFLGKIFKNGPIWSHYGCDGHEKRHKLKRDRGENFRKNWNEKLLYTTINTSSQIIMKKETKLRRTLNQPELDWKVLYDELVSIFTSVRFWKILFRSNSNSAAFFLKQIFLAETTSSWTTKLCFMNVYLFMCE